jgi:hypothetical protein
VFTQRKLLLSRECGCSKSKLRSDMSHSSSIRREHGGVARPNARDDLRIGT